MANKLKNRLGETNISTYGQKMKIIKYVNESDIDVEFDDGTIVEHKRYGNFKIGQIKNPNLKTNPQTKNRVGETNVSTCGQIMKIVKYKDAHDIDVEFEDGTVVTPELLIETGLLKKQLDGVKVLGNGELTKKLTVKATSFSKTAKTKIESVGGTIEVI